jgi:hypothetical protein
METPDFSPWIILILFAFLLVFMWGALFLVLALGTWVIARTRLREDHAPRPPRDSDPDR